MYKWKSQVYLFAKGDELYGLRRKTSGPRRTSRDAIGKASRGTIGRASTDTGRNRR